jgi:hypothetical protein
MCIIIMDRPPEYMDALFKMYPGKWCWSFPNGPIEYENMVWHDEEMPKPTKQEVAKVYEELIDAQPLKELRRERNRRLAEVDWVFSTDYQMEDEERSVWVAYRQALRDLPSTTEDPTNPVWPTKPSTPKGTTLDVNLKNIKDRELSEKSQITLLQNVVYSLTKRIEALENA